MTQLTVNNAEELLTNLGYVLAISENGYLSFLIPPEFAQTLIHDYKTTKIPCVLFNIESNRYTLNGGVIFFLDLRNSNNLTEEIRELFLQYII